MAKGKKHKKGSAATAAGVLGSGAVAGAATYLAGAVVKAITKEAVGRGADRLLKHAGGNKDHRKHGEDLGLLVLRTLADAEAPVPVARLAAMTEIGLLPCLEAVHLLRRARMVKTGDGRRTVELTPVGREALELLSAPGEPPTDAFSDGGDDSGSAEPVPPPPIPPDAQETAQEAGRDEGDVD
ncbi:MAG TPA: hypothetical protein VFB66_21450 [Tepidisphaeraceae bacterium]|nr:hypothetical protein [Tepidisphaeraceae bacterium]